MRVWCWDCKEFRWASAIGYGIYECKFCGGCTTDLVAITEQETEEGEQMSANDNDLLKRECRTKSCQMRSKIQATAAKFCSRCGQKLDIVKDQSIPVDIVDPTGSTTPQPTLPIVTSTPSDDRLVSAMHMTSWKDQGGPEGRGAWVCWCGFSGSAGKDVHSHDHSRTLEKLSSLPEGVRYTDANAAVESSRSTVGLSKVGDRPKQSDNWETLVPDPCVKGCPIVPTDKTRLPRVEIPNDMWKKWCHWAKKFDTEWLAYLMGEEIPRSPDHPLGGWKLTDLWVPRQKVTGAHVTVFEDDIRTLMERYPNCIGDVHSHVKMGVFFSSEDEKHMNHPVHLVVNAREEIMGSCRITLDCGRMARVEGRLILINPDDLTELEEEMSKNFLQPDPIVVPAGAASYPPSPTSQSAATNQPTQIIGCNDTWRA